MWLAEELGMPSAPMPPGVTEIAECVVSVSLEHLKTPDAPPSAAFDPNAPESEYTVEIPDAYRAGAPGIVLDDSHVAVLGVSACPEPYATAAGTHVATSKVIESAQREFAGRRFDLRVVFAPPSLARQIVTPAPPLLSAAKRIDVPPVQIAKKDASKPRELKGGACDVELYVDEKGNVYAADLWACRTDLRLFMKVAVMAWTFEPALVDGNPAPVRFSVNVAVRSNPTADL